MIPGKYSGLITCIAASGVGMFIAVWLLDFSIVRADWCKGVETDCLRQWMSATSGWAAAVVAVASILYLKKQIDVAHSNHKETVLLQELPHRTAATKALAHLRIANSFLFSVKAQIDDDFNHEDVYGLYGDMCLLAYGRSKHCLEDVVFKNLQSIDDGLISVLHTDICEALDEAIAACRTGLARAKRGEFVENEHTRKIEVEQLPTIADRVVMLQKEIATKTIQRYPDFKF